MASCVTGKRLVACPAWPTRGGPREERSSRNPQLRHYRSCGILSLVVAFRIARKLAFLDFFLVAAKRLERIRLEMGIGLHKLRHEIVE